MKQFKKYIFEKLNSLYSSSELDYLERIILEEITQKSFSQLFLHQQKLTFTEMEKAEKIVKELEKNIPIQYVLGKAYFYNLRFFVNENVLIPRPETEELVEWIIEKSRTIETEKVKILDINPPYIPLSEKTQMDKKVTNNEPESALFVPNSTPIIFYEKIADFSSKHLKNKGLLFYEIHQNFGNEVKEMLKEKGFQNIQLKKDISNNDRMICAEI